jgi:alanine racemase
MSFHPAWFEIDLAQFKANIALIRSRIGTSLYCCVVKANAYGHGLVPLARAASDAGVDYLGVIHLQEGVALRKAGISLPILVMGAIHEDQAEELIRYRLEITLSSSYKAKIIAKKARELGEKCTVHLEVDTGMRRTGVRTDSAMALIDEVGSEPYFSLRGIYSHFAMSEKPNEPVTLKQIEQFLSLKEKAGKSSVLWHLANSGGVAFYPESHLDMVRPGILSYGLFPQNAISHLQPILSLKANVSYFKVVREGEGISYGHTYRTKSQTRVVTVPVGYGDGYRRDLSNQMQVLIRGKRYTIAGSICMDQFMVDIGDHEAYVGDEVVLIGKQGNEEITCIEMSEVAKTNPHEILCHFNERIPRIYKK